MRLNSPAYLAQFRLVGWWPVQVDDQRQRYVFGQRFGAVHDVRIGSGIHVVRMKGRRGDGVEQLIDQLHMYLNRGSV